MQGLFIPLRRDVVLTDVSRDAGVMKPFIDRKLVCDNSD